MIVYFDTSALLALYVKDVGSRAARDARGRASQLAASYLAFAEAHAALARLVRDGAIAARDGDRARDRFENDWNAFHRVRLDARLLPEIRRVVRLHGLTGADAVQLASAWWVKRAVERGGGDLRFACADRALRAAAVSDGLALAW